MKNFQKVIPILIILIFVIPIIAYSRTICSFDNCNNKRIKNGKYCIEHTCIVSGCTEQKGIGISTCYYHHAERQNNYQETNKIILTDSQIEQARIVVENYIKTLISEQSSILGVNIINGIPETTTLYIKYRCNVVRKDDDTNLATIYVLLDDRDGSFHIERLEYDDE